jgi:hypothetical protein
MALVGNITLQATQRMKSCSLQLQACWIQMNACWIHIKSMLDTDDGKLHTNELMNEGVKERTKAMKNE